MHVNAYAANEFTWIHLYVDEHVYICIYIYIYMRILRIKQATGMYVLIHMSK